MTHPDIESLCAEAAAKAERATPGPWRLANTVTTMEGSFRVIYSDTGATTEDDGPVTAWACCDNDAAFIAHARTAVPALVVACRQLLVEVTRLKLELSAVTRHIA
jgi:hypothetical protein